MIYIGVAALLGLFGLVVLKSKQKRRDDKARTQALSGVEFILQEAINPEDAKRGVSTPVTLNGKVWNTRAQKHIPAGTLVTVESVFGCTLTITTSSNECRISAAA
jgi:membrane protein implicated in regulation of membrane protease activity